MSVDDLSKEFFVVGKYYVNGAKCSNVSLVFESCFLDSNTFVFESE
jgi:hypothetical protein